ncbi:unnamed protein product [Hymenolepis diminuta]|uniref:UBA domain-containing protein n=1 Tax=Hymenolepis diminuta TaxID=6216 RepID=A0A0R3SXX5_HYMDI|nr:unnamed protein product [Hymenolepis diminuta]
MGLLNVLFEPTGNSTFKTNSNINDIVNYLINVTLERPLSLSVLQALPSKIGGGAEGVKVANANPNREPIILWTTVTVFIFFLVWIIILQIVNCRRCYCCRNTASEGCTYLVEESAVEKTDYVFNSILGKEFDSTSPNELVTIEQPKNVLTALLTKCNYDPAETSVGLLSAVGYSNLVNVFAIADSNTIQKALNDSRE